MTEIELQRKVISLSQQSLDAAKQAGLAAAARERQLSMSETAKETAREAEAANEEKRALERQLAVQERAVAAANDKVAKATNTSVQTAAELEASRASELICASAGFSSGSSILA